MRRAVTWRSLSVDENEARSFFYAPGTNTAIMAGGSWKGLLQAVQLSAFRSGTSHYAVSEEDDKVYRFTLESLNNLSAVPVLARSGTSVVTDKSGNLYVAGAQLFVYSSAGKPLGDSRNPGTSRFTYLWRTRPPHSFHRRTYIPVRHSNQSSWDRLVLAYRIRYNDNHVLL